MSATNRLSDVVTAPGFSATVGITDQDVDLLRQFLERVEEVCDERTRTRYGERRLVEALSSTFALLRLRKRDEVLVRASSMTAGEGSVAEENMTLEVVLPDQPFIVDTIDLFLAFAGLEVVSKIYLAVPVRRDRAGRLVSLAEGEKRVARETVARFEVLGRIDADFRASVETAVRDRLLVASKVVRDFKRMATSLRSVARSLKRVQTVAPRSSRSGIGDTRALIDWLLMENFILMGTSFYPAGEATPPRADPNRQLGHTQLSEDELAYCGSKMRIMANADGPEAWAIVFKSQEESLIHRAGKIDNVLLRSYDADGVFEGCFLLRGLFTFRAVQTPGGEIPLVRLKLKELLDRNGCKPHSLKWKSYTNAFNSIPVEFLFESPPREIAKIAQAVRRVERDKELRTHVVVDEEHRKGLYFLVLPRKSYSEEMRRRIEAILIEGLAATYSDSRVHIGKYDTVLLSFFFTAAGRFRSFAAVDLDETVRAVAGTWEERFYRALVSDLGDARAHVLHERYSRGFPEGYQLVHSPAEAVTDVTHLERIRPEGGKKVALEVLFLTQDREERRARLRVYLRKKVYLSIVLPIFDNFGLQIVDQSTFHVNLTRGGELFIETFRVAGVESQKHGLLAHKAAVLEALEMVLERRVPNDSLNRLSLEAELGWRDIDLLRSYLRYLRQLGVPSSLVFMANTFRQYPHITRLLIEFYRIRFSPDLDIPLEERVSRQAQIAEEIGNALHHVRLSAEENVLRLLLNLFTATLRTSRYRERNPEKHAIAFKIDPERLMVSSEPRPWREIYVHHNDMEGIHLRGGKLARGGIRWSDRINDYREEILGLMRTQMVKNVLIVPVGAKGGFILRNPSPDSAKRRRQADRMYRLFINALLDLTDDVKKGEIVPPARVVCYDGEDTYLVVAADKGTAHLSDAANEISESRGFWLGDAFASGGRHGYDHKVLGITARGAWEGVRRHFREMGLDPGRDLFSVAGIGDMSGDVFGNGMLLSNKMRLLAAFNHQHIFIDPNPLPEESFRERQRLFSEKHSTWRDYDPAVLSSGGGVFDRQAKSIQLSATAQSLLGLEGMKHPPEHVIQRILTLEVDLLWNGGIGTYIKASREDNRDVGDLTNAPVRVNARDVRARVIVEGGNLGVTAAGRVEFALRGGHINTDFVDNSAGVDCSDHEVNLKILLEREISAGRLNERDRNKLLAEVEEDICEAVLHNNYRQSLMLSLDEQRSREDLFSFERAIKSLEDRGHIVRGRDRLPTFETLIQRHARGRGMYRPELATLSAYAKMEVSWKLLELPIDAIPGLEDYISTYFPRAIVDRFASELSNHLLAREIAIMMATNMIIDHAGSVFFFDVERETGATVDRIVRAYVLSDELYHCWGMKDKVIALDGRVPFRSQYNALTTIESCVRNTVAWLLSGNGRLEQVERDKAKYRDLLEEFEAPLPEGLSAAEKERFREAADAYYQAGFEIGLPERLPRFRFFTAGLRIADIAFHSAIAVADVARLYYEIGKQTAILPFVKRCDEIHFTGRWESLALRIIRNSLLDSLWSLIQREVKCLGPGGGNEWIEKGLERIRREQPLSEISLDIRNLAGEEPTIAALQVLTSRLRNACHGTGPAPPS